MRPANSNSATILVTRGTMHVGSVIIAGTTWCKIRQMLDDKNQPIKSAGPGTPVNITGWKELPLAGDKILQPTAAGNKAEDEVKRAVANRIRDKERKALMQDVEVINEKRRVERERQIEEEAKLEAIKAEGGDVNAAIRSEERKQRKEDEERGKKELRLIIRADVTGTVEAVVGSLEGIGNNEVGVNIIHTDVGDVSDSDVAMGEASDGKSTRCECQPVRRGTDSKIIRSDHHRVLRQSPPFDRISGSLEICASSP